jgi:hypothetical protein
MPFVVNFVTNRYDALERKQFNLRDARSYQIADILTY